MNREVARYLMQIANQRREAEFRKWRRMPEHISDKAYEAQGDTVAMWAIAVQELFTLSEQSHQEEETKNLIVRSI